MRNGMELSKMKWKFIEQLYTLTLIHTERNLSFCMHL